MLTNYDIITGEKFQGLADISISKAEHTDFEFKHSNWIDVDNFDFKEFNNPKLVYINSSLINKSKPKLVESKIIDKLLKFRNKFSLILHNSDQDFESANLDLLQIPNLDKIYTQNIAVIHPRVIPLPIGIANSFWTHGNLDIFTNQVNSVSTKSNLIYNNFTVEGGMRPEYRVPCLNAADKLNIPKQSNLPYREFLKELSTFKYCLCPSGNGLDTHRFWECLYLKVIPIVKRKPLYEYFSKLFPVVMLDSWADLENYDLENLYNKFNWNSYNLLKFKEYCEYIKII